jgi:GDP-L-fucose synthase
MAKNVLVTGGTGMIGRCLVDKLLDQGHHVRVASLDDPSRVNPKTEFVHADLCEFSNCLEVCEGMDEVYHLVGIKGSPKITTNYPASFYFATVSANTSMIEAAHRKGVSKYLYTSSVGVYSPAEVFREDDVWRTFPSPHDRFSGWSKRMGELQAEAYQVEYGWPVAIVRPSNVYGPYDNFSLHSGMVVPSLIRKVVDGENPLKVWGDGSAVRDFIYADDVAEAMLLAVEKMRPEPINIGSGIGCSIRELVNVIIDVCGSDTEVEWDTSKPTGDQIRLLETSRARDLLGFSAHTTLREGIHKTVEWYRENKQHLPGMHNVF